MAEARSRPNPEGWRKLAPPGWGKLKAAAFLAVFILAAVMLATALFPELDVALARRFYEGAGKGFALRSQTTLILLRELGYYLPIAVLALTGLAFLLGKRKPRPGGVLTGRRFLFLALSFALGPGLVVNGVLKEVSHRPRPAQIVEFGGTSAFKPWYAVDGACAHNCSFASGEVAGATARVDRPAGSRARAGVAPAPAVARARACARKPRDRRGRGAPHGFRRPFRLGRRRGRVGDARLDLRGRLGRAATRRRGGAL